MGALTGVVLAVAAATLVVAVISLIVLLEHRSASEIASLPGGTPLQSHEDGAAALAFFSDLALNLTALDHAALQPGEDPPRTAAGEHAGPLKAARALAIAHVAMADAVAVATGAFAPYATGAAQVRQDLGGTPVSCNAAVAAAARIALLSLYHGQTAAIEQAAARFARMVPVTGDAGHSGTAAGEAVALLIVAQRHGDGSDDAATINPPVETVARPEPGFWKQDPVGQHAIAMGAGWADVVPPFVLDRPDQFVCPPPPALTSAAYAMEYYETRALGGNSEDVGCVRDAWRTFVGRFWAYDGTSGICAPARLYLQIVWAAARRHELSTTDTARLLGLASLAMADGALAAWHSKYLYLRERPVTAVRTSAAHDGNPFTVADPAWTPLGAPNTNRPDLPDFTPPFPAYPSGHAVFGGAVAEVLRQVLGHDQARLRFVSDEYDGHALDAAGVPRPRIERWFSLWSELEEENGQSRMYLGIHWASDKVAGIAQGRAVANWTVAHAYFTLAR